MSADQQAPIRRGAGHPLSPRAPVEPKLAGANGVRQAGEGRPARAGRPSRGRTSNAGRLSGGGTAGNERLTAATGIVLIMLLAVIGVTILRLRPLISVHLFIGLVLIPPVLLKLGSTGYRFVRYYTSDPVYRARGAPPFALRVLGPVVVTTSVAVLATGVALLFIEPRSAGIPRELHKLSFILWVAFTAIHVLGHLPDLQKTFLTRRGERFEYNHLAAGRTGRIVSLTGALAAGVVLAIVLIPHFGAWAHFEEFRHHH